MKQPYFKWEARLSNDRDIYQFGPEGKETLFKEVEDNKDKLLKFKLLAEDGEFYEADLKKCEINCNGKKVEKLKKKVNNAKLIYSRRTQVRANPQTGKVLSQRVIHRIGLESSKEHLVVEIFPGLEMAERKIEVKSTIKSTKKETVKDLTKELKP